MGNVPPKQRDARGVAETDGVLFDRQPGDGLFRSDRHESVTVGTLTYPSAALQRSRGHAAMRLG